MLFCVHNKRSELLSLYWKIRYNCFACHEGDILKEYLPEIQKISLFRNFHCQQRLQKFWGQYFYELHCFKQTIVWCNQWIDWLVLNWTYFFYLLFSTICKLYKDIPTLFSFQYITIISLFLFFKPLIIVFFHYENQVGPRLLLKIFNNLRTQNPYLIALRRKVVARICKLLIGN